MDALLEYWQTMSTLRQLGGWMEVALNPFCVENGITPLQLNLLVTLHFEGPETVTGLARLNCMAGANNSAMCKRLENEGLVLRRRAREDERQVQVSLTQQGSEIVEKFATVCAGLQQEQKGKMTPEEREALLVAKDILLQRLPSLQEDL